MPWLVRSPVSERVSFPSACFTSLILARPKSRSLAPDFVNMMLPGLRISWYDSLPMSLIQRFGNFRWHTEASYRPEASLAPGGCPGLPFEKLQHQKSQPPPARYRRAQMCG